MYKLSRFFFFVSLFIYSAALNAQITLPAIIGDNMVLQQQSKAPLWGWAPQGQRIAVTTSWNNETVRTRSNPSGRWQLEVNTPEAGGPYSITISGENRIKLNNVMIGEVWLCSGQSNMEMPLKGWPGQEVNLSAEAIAIADYPDLRLFTVKRNTSFEPLNDCEGQWAPCSPENAGDFSAVGFFFGVDLHRKLKVPVGLIHSSWGGTPAEAWTSNEFINKIPYFHTSDAGCDPEKFRERKLKHQESLQKKRLDELGILSSVDAPDWSMSDFDDSDWSTVKVPSSWGESEIGKYQGVIMFRKEFKVFRNWTTKTTVLDLGPIDEMDVVWINGVQVGYHLNASDWAIFRSYDIPPGVLKKGKNILAVLVANTYGIGGINGDPASLKIYVKERQKISKSLSGNWKYKKFKSFKDLPPLPG